jgi:hypothetical protein
LGRGVGGGPGGVVIEEPLADEDGNPVQRLVHQGCLIRDEKPIEKRQNRNEGGGEQPWHLRAGA